MPVTRCRVCGRPLPAVPLLTYCGMPDRAQYLPDTHSLNEDHGADLKVFQCTGCGLVQLSSRPVPYYREVIRASAVSQGMTDFRRKQFTEFVEQHSLTGRRVLEIGCGGGEYLSVLGQCGVNAFGLEQSEALTRKCQEDGLSVHRGFVEDADYAIEGAPFDAFLILSFLEHLPQPNATLTGIRNNLTEGGIGLVEVPNFDMMLGRGLFAEFMSDHLLYFTADTLVSTLRLNGFDVQDCKAIWHDYILSATVVARPTIPIARFEARRDAVTRDLRGLVGSFEAVAVWGAGHQALAILAISGVASRVKYVVDSAPFKQGKFTPVSHIPIVSPAALDQNPVDALVVMAGSYSDEIAEIVRRRHGRRMKVAIVREAGLEWTADSVPIPEV